MIIKYQTNKNKLIGELSLLLQGLFENFEIPPSDYLTKKLILNPVKNSRSARIKSQELQKLVWTESKDEASKVVPKNSSK
jgi:hypothetical protein